MRKIEKAESRITIAVVAIAVIILAVAMIYLVSYQRALPVSPQTSTPTPTKAPITGKRLPHDDSNKTVYVTLVTHHESEIKQEGGEKCEGIHIMFDGGKEGHYNFNGSSNGKLVIYIPAEWSLVVKYINEDDLPHSVGIIANNTPTPRSADPTKDGKLIAWAPDGKLGISGYKEGIGQGETTVMIATSIPKGVYWIACGVPGHAMSGQWIALVSSDTVTEPYYITA
ncbi:sulfocyanin [Desulfurococcaceae archaeon AG1]|jgi:sulfocyanin|nr:sulfocyanin [Desulfurococcaceae archaeon AG1]